MYFHEHFLFKVRIKERLWPFMKFIQHCLQTPAIVIKGEKRDKERKGK